MQSRETTGCIADRCAGLGGQARRECVETCKGIGGCARLRTLAYVVSNCTAGSFHQKLQIRHGDCDPVTVLDFPEPLDGSVLDCAGIGAVRFGFASSPILGAFHRMGVSADGRHVVFEVTDDFSVTRQKLVPPEQPEGIFPRARRGGRW